MKTAFCLGLLFMSFNGAEAQPRPVSRPPITGIAHIDVYEPDLAAAQRFYEGLLGWPEAPAVESPEGRRFLVSDKQYVEVEPMPASPPPCYLAHIAFATSNVQQLLQYMKEKGVDVPKKTSKGSDGSKFFFVNDPEGYRVEFVERPLLAMPSTSMRPVSTHIIHAGLAVRDGRAEDRFYKDVLGFRLYWHSLAHSDGSIDFVSMQVPDGTDWLEYMQNAPDDHSVKRLTSADHFSPGVVSVDEAENLLEEHGWKPSANSPKRHGNDAKWQLNLRSPSGTRVELMEFQPTGTPTVPFTGPQPLPQ